MPSAAFPADETERMATLRRYRLLDTPPDARFDRLTALAAQHFSVPIALISFIDSSRQWFKSNIGMPVQETSREDAVCAHAILRPGEVMVVEDVAGDPRFAGNPLAHQDPPVRFYAGAPILASNGQPLGTLCIIDHQPRRFDSAGRQFLSNLAANASDLMELHLNNLALADASLRDPLTELPNRAAFENELGSAMEAAFSGRPFALLMIDVDGFKPVNDRHGQDTGDEVLRQIGRRLSSSIRASDFPARLGGDVFGIILMDPATHDIARQVARRLIADLSEPILHNGREVHVTVSIGCALALRHGTTAAEVRRAALEALHMAKRNGRHQLVIADEVVPARGETAHNSIELHLANAIEHDALKLQWQPYFRAKDGELIGYEALVRWTSPSIGTVPPSTFIPVAETSGLIGALDEWVLRQACAAAVTMPKDLTISVNLSAYWFSRGELVRLIRSVLDETGLAPNRLILELTERTIITHTESARRSMEFLRSLGIRFALDDFGTSYSSLNYLRKLPFDTIKLDRSFVTDLGSEPLAEAVAGAIINLGHALGMQVCAEGVESVQQMMFLTQGECDLAQGYLLGQPEWVPMHASGRRKTAWAG